jgi:hypothetical protein
MWSASYAQFQREAIADQVQCVVGDDEKPRRKPWRHVERIAVEDALAVLNPDNPAGEAKAIDEEMRARDNGTRDEAFRDQIGERRRIGYGMANDCLVFSRAIQFDCKR